MPDRAAVAQENAEARALSGPSDQVGGLGGEGRQHMGGGCVASLGPGEDDGVRRGGGEVATAGRGAHAEGGPVPASAGWQRTSHGAAARAGQRRGPVWVWTRPVPRERAGARRVRGRGRATTGWAGRPQRGGPVRLGPRGPGPGGMLAQTTARATEWVCRWVTPTRHGIGDGSRRVSTPGKGEPHRWGSRAVSRVRVGGRRCLESWRAREEQRMPRLRRESVGWGIAVGAQAGPGRPRGNPPGSRGGGAPWWLEE